MKTFSLIFASLFTLYSNAQPKVSEKLRIGDKMPDEIINYLPNATFSSSTQKLTGIKGKLVILDFWATWCTPCVASFSKLDSLQKKFSSAIQIIPVTKEGKDKVSTFLGKLMKIKNLPVNSIVNDKTLNSLFPHTYLPHYVWIDAESNVIAITEGDAVNEETISAVLAGKIPTIKEKKDVSLRIAYPKNPLFNTITVKDDGNIVTKELPNEDMLIQSSLTRYIDKLANVLETKTTSIRLVNTSIHWLYRYLLWGGGLQTLNANYTIADIKDSVILSKINTDLTGNEFLNWLKDNGYTYECRVPPFMYKIKFDLAVEELNRYFGELYGIEGVKEKRPQKYLALIRTKQEDKIATKGGSFDIQQDKFGLKIQNSALSNLLFNLSVPLQQRPPLIDETGYTGKVDIELNCQLSSLQAVNKELEKYGLQFVEKEKLMEVAVIRMKDRTAIKTQ